MRFSELQQAVIIDVETTGLRPDSDRVISLAAIKVDFSAAGVEVQSREKASTNIRWETWHEVFNPGKRISARASAVNGFTNEAVKDKPRFAEKAQALRDFIGDLPLVAHNMRFDGSFLDAELERAGVPPLRSNPRLCTMMEAHRRACLFHGENVKWPKLEEAAIYAGVELSQSDVHDALEDAISALKLTAGFIHTDFTPDGRPENRWAVPELPAREVPAPRPPETTERTPNWPGEPEVPEPPQWSKWEPNWSELPEVPEPRRDTGFRRFVWAMVAAIAALLSLLFFAGG
jgi:DNA polymerase III epsilon subunit-like protein